MDSRKKDIIYQGDSIISIEKLLGYAHPVVVKKPIVARDSLILKKSEGALLMKSHKNPFLV